MKYLIEKVIEKMIMKDIIDEKDRSIYTYGLYHIIFLAFHLFSSLLIGLWLRKLDLLIVFLICLFSLRTFAGGHHLQKKISCFFASNFVIVGAVCVADWSGIANYTTLMSVVTILAILIIYRMSPVESMNKILNNSQRNHFGKISHIVLTFQIIIFFLIFLLGFYKYCFVISLSWQVIALLQIRGVIHFRDIVS